MLSFWLVAILMILAAAGFILLAVTGKWKLRNADRNEQNISIARERLQELEREYEQGVIDQELYQQQIVECQKALLTDVADTSGTVRTEKPAKLPLAAMLLIIPLIALPLYFYLGNTAAFDQSAPAMIISPAGHAQNKMLSMEDAIQNLATKLAQNPDNIKGWQMLGRSYMSMRRFQEAANAYGKLYQLVGKQPEVMLAYADALSMARGGQMSGEPFELAKSVLEIQPANITGLWLAGLGYSETGDFDTAIRHWKKLEPLLQTDQRSQAEVRALIAQAEQQLGYSSANQSTDSTEPADRRDNAAIAASITVTVSLSELFKTQVKPDDVVFIYAKAHQGPPMPLAAVRLPVSSLPVTVTLDDSLAMMPQMKLSSFTVVDIGARISRSGSPTGQKGDLEGMTESINLELVADLKLVINAIKE